MGPHESQMAASSNQGAVRIHSKLPASRDLCACRDCPDPLALTATICMPRSQTSNPRVIMTTLISASNTSSLFHGQFSDHVSKNDCVGLLFQCLRG